MQQPDQKGAPHSSHIAMVFCGRPFIFPPAINLANVCKQAEIAFTFLIATREQDAEAARQHGQNAKAIRVHCGWIPIAFLRYSVAFLIYFLRLRLWLWKAKPQVLLGCWGGGYLLSCLLKLTGSRAKIVYWAQEYITHTELPRTSALRYVVLWERLLARFAEVTIVADPVRGHYQCDYLGTNNWFAIRNVPCSSPLVQGPSKLRELIQRLKEENPNTFVFVYPGSICRGAMVPELLDSFEHWPNHTQIIFVGTASSDFPSFDARVNENSSRVRHLGSLPYEDVLRGLCYADAGIAFYSSHAASLNEKFCAPCKVGDYFSVGLPMLLSCNETLKALADECKIGVAIDPRDPIKIAAGVTQLLHEIRSGGIRKQDILNRFREELCMEVQCKPLFKLLCR